MNKKKQNLLKRLLVIFGIIIVVAVAAILFAANRLNNFKEQISLMQTEMDANKQMVYVARSDMYDTEGNQVGIGRGETLILDGEGSNIELQEIYSGADPSQYMSADDIGSFAITEIAPGQPITKNMVTALEIAKDTREYEIQVAHMMVDQKENDVIDVRIMFPNGEDYLLLAKKQIKNLSLEGSLFYTYLNEEEILRLSSATVDAYTTTGTRIYTTRYVESNIQDAAEPNYLVRAETLDLMKNDPNILTLAQKTMNLSARMEMENRLHALSEEQLEAVSNGLGLVDTAQNAALAIKPSETTEYDEYGYDEGAETETETETETTEETVEE